MSTSYLEIIQQQWDSILELYLQFEDKKPVMVYDLDKLQIFAYPYEEFKAKLNKKSQRSLEKQYKRALTNNHMVVFVKDDENSSFLSYSLKIYED